MAYSEIKSKMVNGTGVGALMGGGNTSNKSGHYIDSLERFQKDFATQEKIRRENQKQKKTLQIEKRREQGINKEQKRIGEIEDEYFREQVRKERMVIEQEKRVKKRANVTSLPYNPINLEYQNSKPGFDLKEKDQDYKVRNLVRAQNIENHSNGKYNPVTGEMRMGIQRLVPSNLSNKYSSRLDDHYQSLKINLPLSNLASRNGSISEFHSPTRYDK